MKSKTLFEITNDPANGNKTFERCQATRRLPEQRSTPPLKRIQHGRHDRHLMGRYTVSSDHIAKVFNIGGSRFHYICVD